MANVAVYGPNLNTTGASFHVHAEHCADTRKPLYRGHHPMVFDPDDIPGSANCSVEQVVVEGVYSDQIGEAIANEGSNFDISPYMDDFKFFPCVHK